jgi:hypothetical protein
MRRFRLKTLMLLVVIAALGLALVLQQSRATRREAELETRLKEARSQIPGDEVRKAWVKAPAKRQR